MRDLEGKLERLAQMVESGQCSLRYALARAMALTLEMSPEIADRMLETAAAAREHEAKRWVDGIAAFVAEESKGWRDGAALGDLPTFAQRIVERMEVETDAVPEHHAAELGCYTEPVEVDDAAPDEEWAEAIR